MKRDDLHRLIGMTRTSLVVALMVSIAGAPAASGAFPGGNGKIVFDAYQANAFHLYTVEPGGGGPLEIANATDAAWSPDGSQVAVGGEAIRLMNGDGSGQRLLWSDPDGNVTLSDPSWSPDGNRIAFGSSIGSSSSIASVRIDGRNVTGFSTKGLRGARQPAWSPDGRRIAFIGTFIDTQTETLDAELFVMDGDGTDRVQLTDLDDGVPDDPAWSPDGTRVAFGTINTGSKDIYVVDASTGALSHLTDAFEGSAGSPAWSPDGQRIVHVRDMTQLTVMAADGSDPVTIASGIGDIRSPDWQAACTVTGTSGPDTLVGTAGDDRICAGAGADAVSGGGGNDAVFAGSGDDSIRAGGGNDIVNGQGGGDLVAGGTGEDVLVSGLGRSDDRLLGGDGADRLDVRDGRSGDRADGGPGVDSCVADRSDVRVRCP